MSMAMRRIEYQKEKRRGDLIRYSLLEEEGANSSEESVELKRAPATWKSKELDRIGRAG